MIRKYLLEIRYKGTNYKGWQKQHGLRTVQGTIETALKTIIKEEAVLHVAGRTDAGVHARQQFAHFNTTKLLEAKRFLHSMNALLRTEEIAIINIEEKDETFHARYSCIQKTYKYYLLQSNIKNVFLDGMYWMIQKFDIEKANECAQHLVGVHDFSSFQDADCQAKSAIRTLDSCCFSQGEQLICMEVMARSFLHHQIRIIIGTIFEIVARREPDYIKEILAKKDRLAAGATAPACGLFLEKIVYE